MEQTAAVLQTPKELQENVGSVLQEKNLNVQKNAPTSVTKTPKVMKKPTGNISAKLMKPPLTALAFEVNNGIGQLVQKRVFNSGVPVNLTSPSRYTTNVVPFSFEERNEAAQKLKEEKIKKIKEEAEKQKKTTFRARPVPAYLKQNQK